MQFSRKTIAIIALVIILVASNVAFAVLYMTKNVNITGGVSVVGSIELYEDDGVTPFTSYDFPLFIGGQSESFDIYFFINNTGNQPVYIYWNISSSSIVWFAESQGYGYIHNENGDAKYGFGLWNATGDDWSPNGYVTPDALYIGVGEGQRIRMHLGYTGAPNTPETFTLVASFYAQDF